MEQIPKVQYLPCQKSGYHYGELLNMICLDSQCNNNMLCCCACVQQSHKDHNTKPLRLVLLEGTKKAQTIIPTSFNIDIALELINNHLKESIEHFTKSKKEIIDKLNSIEKYIIDHHAVISDQVRLKNIDPKVELQKAFTSLHKKEQKQEYLGAIRRVSELISVKKQEKKLSEQDILSSIKSATKELSKTMNSNFEEINAKMSTLSKSLQDSSKNINLWQQVCFKFMPNFKHPDIKIVSDLVVKSTNGSGYKFAIMDPCIQNGSTIQELGFKIKESHSNWIAVGVCHRNIVKNKNFGFNFSSIGHGAYMVSANGGSWNNNRTDQNNTIKAFKFVKGDIISLRINFIDKTILFKRNNDKYTLNFNTIQGDELCPCVLFYYLNDQVEFLPNHKF